MAYCYWHFINWITRLFTANMKYFSQTDFDTCNPPCKLEDMCPVHMKKLDKARHIAGIPFILTSAARTFKYEYTRGRDGDSEHVFDGGEKCQGTDIRAVTSHERGLVVKGLVKAGFTRIGINFNRGFIHAGSRPSKDQDVLWHY